VKTIKPLLIKKKEQEQMHINSLAISLLDILQKLLSNVLSEAMYNVQYTTVYNCKNGYHLNIQHEEGKINWYIHIPLSAEKCMHFNYSCINMDSKYVYITQSKQ
jgi:hypothetical protein